MSSFLLRGLGMRTAMKAASGPGAKRMLSTAAERDAYIHSLRPDGKVPNAGLEITFALLLGSAAGGIWLLYAQTEYAKLDAFHAKLKNMREINERN